MGYGLYTYISPPAMLAVSLCIIIAYRYRSESVAKPLLWFMSLTLFLLITNTCELIITDLGWKIFFAKLEHIAFMLIPLCMISFALRYTGIYGNFAKKMLIPVLIIVVVIQLFIFTNELHGFFWKSISLNGADGPKALQVEYGPVYILEAMLVYGLTFSGIVIILLSFWKGHKLYRKQSSLIFIGIILPVIANMVYLFNNFENGMKDYTPVGFAATGVILTLDIFINRLMKVVPIARVHIPEMLKAGLVVVDKNGIIIDINAGAKELFGCSDDVVGMQAVEAGFLKGLIEYFNGSEDLQEIHEEKIQMNEKHLHVKSSRIDIKNSTTATIFLFIDITEQVKREQELETLKDRLVLNEKMAALGQMAGGIAHEINNPLAYAASDLRSARMMIKNSASADPSGGIAACLDVVEEGLDRIASVVSDLRSYADSGRSAFSEECFDLNDSVKRAAAICRNRLKKDTELHLELESGGINICARKSEIDQVLLNMIINATNAMDDQNIDGRYLRILTAVEKRWAVIEMENPGFIEEDNRKLIFDAFYTTRKDKGGTGTGLSIAKTIIEKHHNGEIFVASTSPVRIKVILPLDARPSGAE